MEPIIKSGETYAEHKLEELLEFATDNLRPGPGYSLTVEGMKAPVLAHKELEAFFGHPLDYEAGATLTLIHDPISDSLVLFQLRLPIKGYSGGANLFRTSAGAYAPSIEVNGQTFTARKPFMDPEDVAHFLDVYGVTLTSTKDTTAYQTWRESLLEKTSGWHLVETVEYPEVIALDTAQSSILQREETLSLDPLLVSSIRTFTRSIIQFDDATNESLHTEQVLEHADHESEKAIRLYLKSYKKAPDSPFVDYADVIENERLTALEIGRDSFNETAAALTEIIDRQYHYERDDR